MARALALSATRCERLELRLPSGALGLLRAAMRELGELPRALLPTEEVEVEVMGWQADEEGELEREKALAQRGAGEGVAEKGAGNGDGTAAPLTAAAAVAAALEPYGHLQRAVRVVVRV